jgi:hypothetical protein
LYVVAIVDFATPHHPAYRCAPLPIRSAPPRQ